MAFFEWDQDKYTVYVAEMDEQHQKLVAIINRFYEASQEAPNKRKNEVLFDELINYTKYHFSTEEQLFDSKGYPASESHKAMHRNLVHSVVEVRKKFYLGNGSINQELLDFLKLWLTSHILSSDRQYGQYLLKLAA